ncbi:hypothetical protein RM780_02390 [Streptomyces sp. DSM 44917]|uniref:Integral membrane protein n=1 Tax=Streptomyces boetiae TaxID=3075541 RepID=A0ABU2L3J1_9ACTN|nr:hypothetical protein [Streptomyces sp. DSM 44917]MDT0305813.1 hypothetical protein [Streptomyces sp. DSM 44917]
MTADDAPQAPGTARAGSPDEPPAPRFGRRRRLPRPVRWLFLLCGIGVLVWLPADSAGRLLTGEDAVLTELSCREERPEGGGVAQTVCEGTWRFPDGDTGRGRVEGGTGERPGSAVFAGGDWAYQDRAPLAWPVLLVGGPLLLAVAAITTVAILRRRAPADEEAPREAGSARDAGE